MALEYQHGAYGSISEAGSRVSASALGAAVYIGTAPVHNVRGGYKNVNKPILVKSMAEARKYFGYSDDWASYTLCEAMYVHLEQNGIGPLVLINVLDPLTHKEAQQSTKTLTPVNGRVVITDAESICLDTLTVKNGEDTLARDVDYVANYDAAKQSISIVQISGDTPISTALTITYDVVKPSAVNAAAVVGTDNGEGLKTGIQAVDNVYQLTGMIPAYLLAPGFGSTGTVHDALIVKSHKINGHWDAYVRTDLPLMNGSVPMTMAGVHTWRKANGFNAENETVYFPMVKGIDGKKYHLSVLAAANFQKLLREQDGIPYKTASNTEIPICENLYMGEANEGRVYDDAVINEQLNKNGIASAAFVGGRWVIWGAHAADYDQDNASSVNVAETNRQMLYYVSNDFQHRRARDVDKPLTRNDVASIVAEEQTRLDALFKIGAITYGSVNLDAEAIANSDIMNVNFAFAFDISTAPLAKVLTAKVRWTEQGFVTFFESLIEA